MDETSLRRAALGLRYSRRAGILFLAGLGCYLVLPSPWTVLGAACALAALLDQVRAFRAFGVIRHAGQLRTMSAISALACLMLLVLAAAPTVLDLCAPARRDCERGANTAAAREDCRRQFGDPPGGALLQP